MADGSARVDISGLARAMSQLFPGRATAGILPYSQALSLETTSARSAEGNVAVIERTEQAIGSIRRPAGAG